MIEIEKSSGNVYADLESPDAGELLSLLSLARSISSGTWGLYAGGSIYLHHYPSNEF